MEQKTYNIKFQGIDLVEKKIYRVNIHDNELFSHEVITQSVADAEKNIVVTFVAVHVRTLNDSPTLVAEIMAGFGFFFENFETVFAKGENDKHIVPLEVENLLKTIAISTMRGIMYSEFRGTQLHKAILPIIVTDSLKPMAGNLLDLKKEENYQVFTVPQE